MDRLSPDVRKQIVEEELTRLKQENYISTEVYEKVTEAEQQFHADTLEKNEAIRAEQQRARIEKEDGGLVAQAKAEAKTKAEAKPPKVKKQLSAKEMRERNITWLLNLGVILLLIGGLVLATSTWDVMGDWAKTGLIALVSVLFFGLAYITRHVLKIEKTGFAFHVLGSLFLPIVILSAGYFELFGPYFSYAGEGRYLFGAAGSLFILPIYLLLAARLGSRLFIWFSYITISVLASFLIAALYLPADGFYLGIMLFNAVLIVAYTSLRKSERLKLFTNEFSAYIQANLVLSTLLMLLFYEQDVSHGFNLLLTATLYFAMIFVTNHRNYHFVFSVMLVYGVYQFIEFSALHAFGPVLYALLGFIFIAIPLAVGKDFPLKKAFQYTSAVVSGLAFLYISLEGMLLRMEEASFMLLFAYVIISLNVTYLTTVVNRRLFRYLSPVFLSAALYEAVLLGQDSFGYESLHLPMFLAGLTIYLLIGCFVRITFFKQVKTSTRDITSVVMVVSIFAGYVVADWWQTGTMLLLVSLLAVIMDRYENRTSFKSHPVSAWIHALALGFAIIMLYAAFFDHQMVTEPFSAKSFAWSGILMLAAGLLWRTLKRQIFFQSTFYTACGFYAMAIMMALQPETDVVLRTLIVLGGVGVAGLLYRKTNATWAAFVVSGLSLLFYLTVLYAVDVRMTIHAELYQTMQFVTGAVLLLATGAIIGSRDARLKYSFWWTGHLYLPLALLYGLMLYGSDTIWAFALSVVLYGVSVWQAAGEWRIKTFLYASFTTFWMTVLLAMTQLELDHQMPYAFLITSGVIGLFWFVAKGSWPKRIAYFAAPFSMLGILAFIMIYPYDIGVFVVTLVYAAGVLVLLHKQQWHLVHFIPLALIYWAVIEFSEGTDELTLILLASFGPLISVFGYMMYPLIYQDLEETQKTPFFDWYSIVGLMTFISLYSFMGDALWTKLLPGLLISVYVVFQRKRIPDVPSNGIMFAGCLYLVQPYYALLGHLDIPALIEMDLYVLPWVIPAVLLKKVTNKTLATRLQWAILLVVALLLVIDGLDSNTIYDALIIGSLSLISILAGMAYQMKSFFFVGAGVLLLNVFLQTRPYWGNLPWWVYLLIAGSVLIIVASYNEWHKQKTSDGKETVISKFNRNVVQRIKRWE